MVWLNSYKSFLVLNVSEIVLPFIGFEDIMKAVKERKLLNDGGLFIYEHKTDKPSVEINGFELFDTRKYGIAVFDFYKEGQVWK